MRLEAACEVEFDLPEPCPLILMLRPRSGAGQWVRAESYEMTPSTPVVEYVDGFGNLCQRVVAPVGRFRVRSEVSVETSDVIDVAPGAPATPVEMLPYDVMQFLLPSRYCEADALADMAEGLVAGVAPGYDQVEAIRAWIRGHITYQYGTSDASTSARDTARDRAGVCRDFAHLGMALTRALNIPARMVVGYLHELNPMDLHAWFEAFVAGRWYTFDATQAEPRGGRIVIAYGRDAADVALATQFGPGTLERMEVVVRRAGEGAARSAPSPWPADVRG